MRARGAAALAVDQAAEFVLAQPGRIDVIELDPTLQPSLLDDAGLMQVIPRSNPGLQALAHYGALLLRGLLPLNSAELQTLAKAHVHDLIGAAFADREPVAPAAMADRRAGRLAAIKADIEARLERRELGVEMSATLSEDPALAGLRRPRRVTSKPSAFNNSLAEATGRPKLADTVEKVGLASAAGRFRVWSVEARRLRRS